MVGDYTVSDIYQGGYSSLNPDYGSVFTGYRVDDTSTIGLSTDPRTANILKDVSEKIAPGIKNIELSLIQPEILESIPKQHLEEINRLSKLTGVDVTVHGPLIDASGVTQQGFEDQQREIAERKIISAIEKSHTINPNGNSPITFHTANQLPGARYTKTKEGEHVEFMPIVNQETGQISGASRKTKIAPFTQVKEDGKIKILNEIKEKKWSVNEQVKSMNTTTWDKELQELIIPKEHADRIIAETAPLLNPILKEIQSKNINPENLTDEQKLIINKYSSRYNNAKEQLEDMHTHLSSLFDKAYKYGSDSDKKILKDVAKDFGKNITKNGADIVQHSNALQGFMEGLRQVEPVVFKSAEKYALEKSHETFGNAAWSSYKKFGDKAPIISIENPPAGMGLSRAKNVKEMVKGAREQFINNAVTKGMSKKEAEKKAEKLIGATWDVGHINQLRQFGFTSEDIIKEAEVIAPYVKHVHLSDNFGMENTELPMGMGNVDLKEIMKKLGKKGEKARKIIEAAHWWQHQQTSPVGVSFEALGSPMYSMNMAPYWNQSIGLQQGYFEGYGQMLPPMHYETFGAGFSQLPTELGGQRQGGGGRMSGRPME
jgi:sugar phosphate isomerase/epimerase